MGRRKVPTLHGSPWRSKPHRWAVVGKERAGLHLCRYRTSQQPEESRTGMIDQLKTPPQQSYRYQNSGPKLFILSCVKNATEGKRRKHTDFPFPYYRKAFHLYPASYGTCVVLPGAR